MNYVDQILNGDKLIEAVNNIYTQGKDKGERVFFNKESFELSEGLFDLITSTIDFITYFETSSKLPQAVKDQTFLGTINSVGLTLKITDTWESVFSSLDSLEAFLINLDTAMQDVLKMIKTTLKNGNTPSNDIWTVLSFYEVHYNIAFDCSLADMLYSELQGE